MSGDIIADGRRTAVWRFDPAGTDGTDGMEGTDGVPTILAVHGFRGTHLGLVPLARALAAGGFRVYVPDLPGSGASERLLTAHDAAGYGEWLVALSDALGTPDVLLGHSFGSVVVSAALSRGVPSAGAVLINPIVTPPLARPHRIGLALTRAYYGMAAHLPEQAADAVLGSRVTASITAAILTTSREKQVRRQIRAEHIRQAPMFGSRDAVLETFRAATRSSVPALLGGPPRPVLVLGGDHDSLSPTGAQQALARRLPEGAFRSVPAAGHLIPYEAPGAASTAIVRWYRESGCREGSPALPG